MTNAEAEKRRQLRFKGVMFDDEDTFGIIKAILESKRPNKC